MKGSRRKGEVYISNGPFIAWCREQICRLGGDPDQPCNHSPGTRHQLAETLGISERTLYRHMVGLSGSSKPTKVIGRFAVDEMLTNAGEDFYDVYPEFAHEIDIDLEPDAFCRLCGEVVTPINGRCPWDDCSLVDSARMAA